jgi:hypothetical protein
MSIEVLVAMVSFVVLVLSWIVLPAKSQVGQMVDERSTTPASAPALVTG